MVITSGSAAIVHRAPEFAARLITVGGAIALAVLVVSGQLVRLALRGQVEVRLSISEPLTRTYARPDIVDRHGRLLATDVESHSLYADPALILDVDEVVEKLVDVFPDLDAPPLRRLLSDATRRFVWVRRGLGPVVAQRVHDLGLPGLAFRKEPKRAYPMGSLAGHVLGHVNVDNRGLAGIERHIDETVGIEAVLEVSALNRPPVRLAIELGTQHSLEQELRDATDRYRAAGASGLIMDVESGEVVAAASVPEIDPQRPGQALDAARLDKIAGGTYELGSIFKALTVAMALEAGTAGLDKVYDVRVPLRSGPYTIRDLHPQGRPLSVREIFLHSSNVGAAMMALEVGVDRQREFLGRLGLLAPMRSEAGPLAPPGLPRQWRHAETITIAYGHGLAVSPLQFAAAAAALVNGGERVIPTFLARGPVTVPARTRVIAPETSVRLRELLRRNVTHPHGSGRRADVAGYEVGGKTGTAELAGTGGYRENEVVASFLAVFPMSAPRYIVLVTLHQPAATAETRGEVTAGLNAAPAAGRIIARAAPLLGVLPRVAEASGTR